MPLKRVSAQEALDLYNENDLNKLSLIATEIREKINGNKVLYNQNFHLEPSNVCIHRCKFCSYRRDSHSDTGAWSMSCSEIEEYCKKKFTPGMTEVHIVGSVEPGRGFDYYRDVIATVRSTVPKEVSIKAYSAVEIDDMSKSSGKDVKEILKILIDAGLSSLPGGGAEIFNSDIRNQICPDKCSGERWLEIHETAHQLGLNTNATMLFGHIESRIDRIEHILKIRDLQDKTGGFNAFIPLLFKNSNNRLSHIKELDITEILKTFAISRILLDNVPHIKSYWPMLGKEMCQLTLLYGADDIDGTINNSTQIYSMAGSLEQKPNMSSEDLKKIASACGYMAIERDSLYNEIKN